MREVENTASLIVRRRSTWRLKLLVAASAFCLTAASVCYVSCKYFQKSPAETGSKAIAVVEQKPSTNQDVFPGDSKLGSHINLNKVKVRVLSPEFLNQVLLDSGIETSQTSNNDPPNASQITPDQLRQGLYIHISPGNGAGENRIVFELSLRQSPDAPMIVLALADRFIREYKTYWTSEMRKAYLEALTRADLARQARGNALEKFQNHKDSIKKREQLTAEQEVSRPHTEQETIPQTIDNPAWIELDDKLALLRQDEAKMLEYKTPLHPDIQNIRDRIADFEQQIALTPRYSTDSLNDDAARQEVLSFPDRTALIEDDKQNKGNKIREDTALVDQNKMNETLNQLKDMAELTRLDYEQQLYREKQVFEASRREPIFSVGINQVAITKKEQKTNPELIELMLFSGFAMALGMSVISSGVAAQPALATIAELEPFLPVPIIGVVPSKNRSFDPVRRRRWQVIGRWSMVVLGGLIVLGCLGGLSLFFAHFK